MKKELIRLGLVAGIATSSLFGFTYEIKQGWQQLGAIKDFDVLKPFDDASCVEYLWHYDLDEPEDKDKWKLHISDGKNYNYCGETFSSLNKGDGFWLKASGECNITVEDPINCPSDNMAPPTPPAFDESCDTNVSIPDNNSSYLNPLNDDELKNLVKQETSNDLDLTIFNTNLDFQYAVIGSYYPKHPTTELKLINGKNYLNDGHTDHRLNLYNNNLLVIWLSKPTKFIISKYSYNTGDTDLNSSLKVNNKTPKFIKNEEFILNKGWNTFHDNNNIELLPYMEIQKIN